MLVRRCVQQSQQRLQLQSSFWIRARRFEVITRPDEACKHPSTRRGPRGISVMSKSSSRRSGGRYSDLFEEWLDANPLPDAALRETKQQRSSGSRGAAEDEEFGACRNPNYEKLGIGNGKMAGEECGNCETVPQSIGVLDNGQEGPAFGRTGFPIHGVKDFSKGPTKASGLRLGEQGLQHRREFWWQETGDVLYQCLCECDELVWDSEQQRCLEVKSSRGGWRMEFIPPLIQLPISSCCTPREYLQSLHERRERQGNKQLLALLSSNAAALAVFNDGKLLLHKVITGYTVRAKQGTSQLKYLRKGGPGRMTVGGAVRARESHRFFTRVCKVYGVDNLKLQVSRNDSRWYKVPYSVHEPCFREVQRMFYRLSHGTVGYTCHREQHTQH